MVNISFAPIAAGFLYRPVVPHAFNRRVVSRAELNHVPTTRLPSEPDMAVGQRSPANANRHIEQGARYSAVGFRGRWRRARLRPPIRAVGDAYKVASRMMWKLP
jgi:hypothetical protein